MIRVGVVNPETWDFFQDIYGFLSANYKASTFQVRQSRSPIFRERIDKQRLKHDIQAFLRKNDVTFFEWSSHLLALATALPKTGRIITRLHRWELYGWADRINWHNVDHIILVSEAKRSEFLQKFPEQQAKTEVIPAGTCLTRFNLVRREFSGSIGTLCHLSPRKRIYELVLTFSELIKKAPSLRLFIAGGPDTGNLDYYRAIRSLVEKLSLQQYIFFDGHISNPWEWYPKIDIFVSNSFSEGLQVAPMEAMASGCYTLSHLWEGAQELVPKDCLYLTGRDLEERILEFCELPNHEKEQQSVRMHTFAADRFDIQKVKLRIGSIIEHIARC